ncbi:restriction endonuclease subunit S [Streptomyces achromogenes]|uniref:restriction endonuclease subunit S n=1 Tax=Streptomyces achromogenes TaxID=67255 RepID=UPI00369C6AB4
MRTVRVKSVIRNVVQKSDGSPQPFLGLEDLESGTGRLLVDELPYKAAEDSVCHAPGDVLFSKLRPYLAKSYLPKEGGTGTGELLVLRPGPAIDSRFLLYVTLSAPWVDWATTTAYGTKMPRTSWELVGNYRFWLPSLERQSRIADFLDTEVSRIDRLVTKKRHLIELLNERINSRVLDHVGASTLVKSNGSPTVPIRRILDKVVRAPKAGEDTITAYRDGQVTARSARRAEGYTLPASAEPQGQHVEVGDVVIHGLDGFAGAIGTSEARGNCSPVYHVCVPRGNGDTRFLGRLLRLLALQGYLGNFATSTRERAVDFRNWDLFGRIPIPDVSVSEQREIGDWISNIRPLREVIERSATLARERRQALITAAVTGQFDVISASGRNVTEGVCA